MNVCLIDKIHPSLIQTFEKKGWSVTDIHQDTDDEVIRQLPKYDGIIIRSRFKLTDSLLKTCSNLKFIGRPGAGLENIDLLFCEEKGIQVFRSPEGNRDAVAEHAVGSLISLLRYIPKSNREVKTGVWDRLSNRGEEIMGKTIGIIGYGYMGNAFAKRISSFGAKLIAYDKYKHNFSDQYVTEVDLDTLKQEADIISLHTPLTDETKGLIDDSFISSCSKSFWLLNTARGQSVVLNDLVKHLKSGKVKGASLDVLEIEKTTFEEVRLNKELDAINYLSEAENVILTPHVAGWTHQSNEKMARFLAEKIVTFYE